MKFVTVILDQMEVYTIKVRGHDPPMDLLTLLPDSQGYLINALQHVSGSLCSSSHIDVSAIYVNLVHSLCIDPCYVDCLVRATMSMMGLGWGYLGWEESTMVNRLFARSISWSRRSFDHRLAGLWDHRHATQWSWPIACIISALPSLPSNVR